MKTLSLPGLKLTIGIKDCCAFAALSGEADMSNASTLEAEMSAMADQASHLLVDCESLTFIDSSGFEALVRAHLKFGEKMAVVSSNRHFRQLLEITGLSEVLAVFDSEIGAKRHLHSGIDEPVVA